METISIALACSVIGAIVGIATFNNNKQKSIKQETKEESSTQTKVEMQLNYISRGIDDIKLDMKMQDKKINDLVERVAKLEESTKSAHKRIDDIEKGDVQ